MKIVKILVSVLVVVAVVFGAVNLIKKRKLADEKEKTATIYPIKVKEFIAKEKNITLTLPYLAEVKNDKDVVINSKFSGKLIFVKNLGDEVQKGEVVAKIDDSELKANLKDVNTKISSLKDKLRAENISLNNLKATHKRTKALLDVKMASIEEYQNEKTKIATLKAQILADKNSIKSLQANKDNILNNFTYTEIKSPINGIVSGLFVNKNDNVFMAKPIIKISSKEGNYLFITLPTQKQRIIYKGKIYKLTKLNLAINGLLAYKVKVNDSNLINGQKININIVEFSKKGIAVPYDAILSIDNKHYVFDINSNPKEIKILAKGQNKVVIKGINDGESIIVAKPDILLRIKAGYPVEVGE